MDMTFAKVIETMDAAFCAITSSFKSNRGLSNFA
jgi:hypothetical protein